MSKLRISLPVEEKPVKLRIELPTALYKDIQLYAELLAAESGSNPVEPEKLIVPLCCKILSTATNRSTKYENKNFHPSGKNQTEESDCEEKGTTERDGENHE